MYLWDTLINDALRITTIQDITNGGSSSSPNSIQSTNAFKFAIFGYFAPSMYDGCIIILNNMISTSFDKAVYIASRYNRVYTKKSSDGKTLYWYASDLSSSAHIYVVLVY